jgi:hypothetical protein
MFQANEEAHMGPKGWTRVILMIVGAIIGAVIGYLAGKSAVGVVIGAGIGAAGSWLLAIMPIEFWMFLAEIGQIVECCSSFGVLLLASIVTLGGLLLWHSLALAALAGIGVMTVLLLVLSIAARLYKHTSTVRVIEDA